MIIFSPQDFITWANMLVQFPWLIQLTDFSAYAEQLGWKSTSLSNEFTVFPDNDYEFTTLSSSETGDVYKLFLYMAVNDLKNDEGAVELNDHFVSCVAAGKKAWGEPFLLEAGDGPGVTWRFPGDMFTQVARGRRTVMFRFFTPQGQWYFL